MPALTINDLDQRIWNEELDSFVPDRIFDAHTHIYRWAFNTDPERDSGPMRKFVRPEFENADWDLLHECDELLMPGRHVDRLAFPFPFSSCDFDASNEFIAAEIRDHRQSGALMLVHPGMTADHIESSVSQHGFRGLKPYRVYSSTGDSVNCRMTDFLPEHQIAVADRLGLLIMMHLSKPDGISDAQNLDDLAMLTSRYPNARWILAHCARSYSSWSIERAGQRLRDMPNTWFDTSSVCEADAIAALIRTVGIDRVMYGSDDVPVGVLRGKYISFGYGWAFLSETNHQLNLSHCDSRMTFTRYEELRAMKRAAQSVSLTDSQIEALFYDNAVSLIHSPS